MHRETECVHSGKYRDSTTRGVTSPIFTSSSYEYLDRDDAPYPRYFNLPNQEAVVRKLCALEGAEIGVLFSSGMAAISTAVLANAGAGDHVVLLDELYGGTHAFATDTFDRLAITHSFARTDADLVAGRHNAPDQGHSDRITDQPPARNSRYPAGGRLRQESWDHDDHGQHLCHPHQSEPP